MPRRQDGLPSIGHPPRPLVVQGPIQLEEHPIPGERPVETAPIRGAVVGRPASKDRPRHTRLMRARGNPQPSGRELPHAHRERMPTQHIADEPELQRPNRARR